VPRVAEIGEPLDLGRYVRQPVELGGGEQPVAGRDLGRKLVASSVVMAISPRVSPDLILNTICYPGMSGAGPTRHRDK
jgi:hypothetical protein